MNARRKILTVMIAAATLGAATVSANAQTAEPFYKGRTINLISGLHGGRQL